MNNLRSFVCGMMFIAISAGINLSCSKNNSQESLPVNNQTPEKPTPKPAPTPTPGPIISEPDENNNNEEEKIIYQWYYKGAVDVETPVNDIKDCPADFIVEGQCEKPLTLCKRKINLYACYPENLEVRITGRVVDENNRPIENVKINGSLGYDGFDEYGTTFTKKNGLFVLKISNSCVPLIHALKDAYTNSVGRPLTGAFTKCRVDNFIGAKDIVMHLKKADRTLNNLAQPISEPQKCRIVGKVFSSDGKGLMGVKVYNGRGNVESDKDGNYILEKNEKCENYCTLSKEGFSVIYPEESKYNAVVSCFQGQPADVIFKVKN